MPGYFIDDTHINSIEKMDTGWGVRVRLESAIKTNDPSLTQIYYSFLQDNKDYYARLSLRL